MAKLNDDVKKYIVQSLGCFDTPQQVADAVLVEYNIKVNRWQVQQYDPTKVAGRVLSKKYVELFYATREAFLEDISQIPIAHQSFRLRGLNKSYEYFASRKNFIAANAVLEQAAKEVGGIYTNKIKETNNNDPLLEWARNLQGGSIPIAYDIEEEFTELKEGPEVKQATKRRVNWVT